MLTHMQFNSIEQLNDSRYLRTSSSALPMQNSYHQLHLPVPDDLTCSAYFLTRVDLSDYTVDTLKQIVDRHVSGPKSKGLKVTLSLPDEGFIIENVLDSNQSWMYKTSELLYFWRDSFYTNIIVVITLNRSASQQQAAFSGSIFRLRGNDSAQLFLQRAQQFFGQLSLSNGQKKSNRKQSHRHHHYHHHHRHSKPKSIEPTPEKSPQPDSIYQLANHRTYSETTTSTDSQKSNLNKNGNDDNDEKMTSVSNTFSNEYVLELVRELRALRSEIALLKIEQPKTPTRSISTSPIMLPEQEIKIDKQPIALENSNNKRKSEQINIKVNKRAPAQDILLKTSSKTNGHSTIKEDNDIQPTSYPSRNHSLPMETEPSFSVKKGDIVSFQSSFDDTLPPPTENIYENIPIVVPAANQEFYYKTSDTKMKDNSQVLVTLEGDHNSQEQQQYLSKLFGPENGISLLIPPDVLEKKLKPKAEEMPVKQTAVPTAAAEEEEEDEEELVVIGNRHPNVYHQVVFADRLTNPLFNVDRQLLANTIANQFGIEPNSPYLEKLIDNQHLFVSHKRTFANMIWQMTPEEHKMMCSSPVLSSNIIEKPITKTKNSLRSISKGQRISWDNSLD